MPSRRPLYAPQNDFFLPHPDSDKGGTENPLKAILGPRTDCSDLLDEA